MTIRVNLGARLIIFIYLCNRVFSLNDGQDTLLLDRRWLLESVGIDTSQDFFLKSHLVEFLNFLIPVCFETFFSFLSYIDHNTSDRLQENTRKTTAPTLTFLFFYIFTVGDVLFGFFCGLVPGKLRVGFVTRHKN